MSICALTLLAAACTGSRPADPAAASGAQATSVPPPATSVHPDGDDDHGTGADDHGHPHGTGVDDHGHDHGAAGGATLSDLEQVCIESAGLPTHELDGFADDFWGDVYKTEVRAARDMWLTFCGRLMPDNALRICLSALDDAEAPPDADRHDQIMAEVAEQVLWRCDQVLAEPSDLAS